MNPLRHFPRFKAAALAVLVAVTFGCESSSPEEEPAPTPPVPVAPPANLSPVERHGQLKVQGSKIVNQKGEPVQLRGMSLFWSQWIGGYYNAAAVKTLKEDWRSTVVRVALGVEPDGYLKNPAVEKQKVITVVDAAIKEGIYVIIDWHDHEAHLHTEQAKAFFGEMAQRYGKYPNVIYEPFNEPLANAAWATQIKPYHEAILQEIRKHDPDNLVVCGTRTWSQQVEEAANNPIKDANVAYTLHYYAATHKQGLRDAAARAIAKGAALFVTEFGTCEASGDGVVDVAETKAWWAFLDQHKISWCNWSLADKNEAASALKPGASVTGPWSDAQLTKSGLMVRQEMIDKSKL